MNGAPLPRGARVPGAPDRAGLVRRRQRQVADAHRGAGPALRGPLHGARLRDDPRGDARRPDGLDVQHGQARPAQVGAGQGHAPRRAATRSWAPPGGRRSPRSRSRSTTAAGGRPSSTTDVAAKDGRGSQRLRLEVLDARLGQAGRGRAHDPLARVRRRRQRPARAGRPVPREQGHVLGEQRADHPPGGDPGRSMRAVRLRSGDRAYCRGAARPYPADQRVVPGAVKRSPAGPAAGRGEASLDGRGPAQRRGDVA